MYTYKSLAYKEYHCERKLTAVFNIIGNHSVTALQQVLMVSLVVLVFVALKPGVDRSGSSMAAASIAEFVGEAHMDREGLMPISKSGKGSPQWFLE